MLHFPFMIRLLQYVSLALLGALAGSGAAFDPPDFPSMEFKMLVVLKTSSEAPNANCSGTLNETEVANFANSFLNVLPTLVHNMTAGVVRLNTEVVLSPNTLMNISDYHEGIDDFLMIEEKNVPDDIALFNITAANYDHLYIIGPHTHWGFWSYQGRDAIGWSSSNNVKQDMSSPGEVGYFLHEFLHPTISWFFGDDRLGKSQSPGSWDPDDHKYPLHNGEVWNYTQKSGGAMGIPIIGEPFTLWNKWYMDFLNGEICMQDGNGYCQDDSDRRPIGLGSNAWKYPSRREAYHNLSAGYLATYGTWPGEPSIKSSYQGPSYTGFTSARKWSRKGDATASRLTDVSKSLVADATTISGVEIEITTASSSSNSTLTALLPSDVNDRSSLHVDEHPKTVTRTIYTTTVVQSQIQTLSGSGPFKIGDGTYDHRG